METTPGALHPTPVFPALISSSLRQTFNACHQKFFNETVLGLLPIEGTNVHLAAGAAYAAALEGYRSEFYGGSKDYDTAVAEGLYRLVKAYGPDAADGETKTLERTIAAFVEYLYRYPPGTEHITPSIGVNGPRVEFSFTFDTGVPHPVSGDPILYCGTFDQLADYNGGLFIFDDKTTGRMGALWKKQWDLRSQFTGYVVGAQLSGMEVIGAIVRGMCILKTMMKTEECITYRPQWMIDRWKRRLVWDVQRMVQCWKDNYWPHIGEENGQCTNYGVCAYHTLCTAQNPQNYIPVFFKESRWDPLERERHDRKGSEE